MSFNQHQLHEMGSRARRGHVPGPISHGNNRQSPALESEAMIQSMWKDQEILNSTGNSVLNLFYI